MQLLELSVHTGYICRPPNLSSSDVSYLTQALIYLPGFPSSRNIITGDFSALKRFWPLLSAPPTLLEFVLQMHSACSNPPLIFHNILDLDSVHRTRDVRGVTIRWSLVASFSVTYPLHPCVPTILPLPICRLVETKSLKLHEPSIGPASLYHLTCRMWRKTFAQNVFLSLILYPLRSVTTIPRGLVRAVSSTWNFEDPQSLQ